VVAVPKTPSIVLKKLLEKEQVELLDIYHRSDGDIIRVKDKLTGKVGLHTVKMHVRDIIDEDKMRELAAAIVKELRG
jgi:hypothetical protein